MLETLTVLNSTLTSSNTTIQVVKRDGSPSPLNIAKIRAVVEWACANLDANSIELESGLKTRLRDGVTTREIQDNLINCALEMCSPNEPDWRYVAGRLHIWSLWKDTLCNRGYQYGNYLRTVQTMVAAQAYDSRILEYSSEELREAGSWINPDWDTDYDYAGAVLLTKRYLLVNELPQEAFLTCSLLLALPEKPENRLKWAKRFYEAIAQRKISLATPILANLRVPNGSLSSCFITAIDDNLESIFGEITNAARISKNGGGIGVNVSRIRATGSWVMGKANASGGVIPWIKLLNDTAIAVNQGGRRAGAITISLDIWHLDVPEFLEMQTENGDQRRKAYDIFPQLVISDEFMRRVVNREDWILVDPYEVKVKLGIELAELWGDQFEQAYRKIEGAIGDTLTLYKIVKARDLFKMVMRSQVETGMPYLWFKDTSNRANPNQHEGYIPGGNLCQESWSNVAPGKEAHTCLAKGTKVLTESGFKPIEDCDGVKVLVPFQSDDNFTISERFEVAQLIDNGIQDVYRITLKNGLKIDATADHKFLTRYGSQNRYRRWNEVKDIQIGDNLEIHIPTHALPGIEALELAKIPAFSHQGMLVSRKDAKTQRDNTQHYHKASEVVSIEYIGKTQVYDLSIPNGHHFVAEGIVTHNCNLDSLNLATIENHEIATICETAVRILDNTIEITNTPFNDSKVHNHKYRTIGVGCMGLADWLAKRKLSYSNLTEINHLFEDIGYYCTYSSMELAKERGAYPAFEGSEWSKGHLIGAKPVEWFLNHAHNQERWQHLSDDIKQHGIRNSHITAIAPNTSSSLVQGCTASVLPTYSRFFYDKWAKGTVPIAPPYIRDYYWYYQENKNLDQQQVVKAVAIMQQWIDTGISMELIFNLNKGVYFPEQPERFLKAKDIFEILVTAWQEGCKAIYYIRTVQKDDFKESHDECVACAN